MIHSHVLKQSHTIFALKAPLERLLWSRNTSASDSSYMRRVLKGDHRTLDATVLTYRNPTAFEDLQQIATWDQFHCYHYRCLLHLEAHELHNIIAALWRQSLHDICFIEEGLNFLLSCITYTGVTHTKFPVYKHTPKFTDKKHGHTCICTQACVNIQMQVYIA